MISLSVLNEFSCVRHGFFTREGGVSTGIYASLNCGPGSADDPASVRENRARAMAMIDHPPESLLTVHQAHTADVVVVDTPWAPGEGPVADAMVTDRPGLVLGILTADCAPLLLVDPKARVIAAVHAGWKGALGGVIDNALKAMAGLGAKPERTVGAVGPCIGQRSYEVGAEFPAPFLAEDPINADFFAPSPAHAGHHLFDLPGYVSRKLSRLGVHEVSRVPADTCRDQTRFFSYRRATVRGEPDYGRQLSVILLER
jgi:YfiH family protein